MLRTIIYDVITLAIIALFVVTFVYIIKDRKGQNKGITILWCIFNQCFPIIGFIVYCLCSQLKENKNS